MNDLTISCICIAGAGLLLAIISIPFFLHKKAVSKNCTEKTKGKVVKYRFGRGGNQSSIAPVVEFDVNGKTFKAYRHYRAVSSRRSVSFQWQLTLNPNELFGQSDCFYISEKDIFHINTKGVFHNYKKLAEGKWPLGSEMTVVYNPRKPRQAFVEKVVVISDIVGIGLLSCGCGMIAIAGIAYMLLS